MPETVACSENIAQLITVSIRKAYTHTPYCTTYWGTYEVENSNVNSHTVHCCNDIQIRSVLCINRILVQYGHLVNAQVMQVQIHFQIYNLIAIRNTAY